MYVHIYTYNVYTLTYIHIYIQGCLGGRMVSVAGWYQYIHTYSQTNFQTLRKTAQQLIRTALLGGGGGEGGRGLNY